MTKAIQKKELKKVLKAVRVKGLKGVKGINEIERKLKLMIKAVDNPSIKLGRSFGEINQYTKSFVNRNLDMKTLAKAKYHGIE